jgi:hypothetical protein
MSDLWRRLRWALTPRSRKHVLEGLSEIQTYYTHRW